MVVVAATLARADVTYNVFPAAMNPNCDPAGKKMSDGHSLGAKPAGFCHELGKGKAAYNSIEVIACSAKCLCFTQYASSDPTAACDGNKALGQNVKEACLGDCMVDCNGADCGLTATVADSGTRLALLGEGQICAAPQSDADYSCATTGMVKVDGKTVSTKDAPSSTTDSGARSIDVAVGFAVVAAGAVTWLFGTAF